MEKNGIEEDDIKKEKNSHLPKNYYTNRKKGKQWHSRAHKVFNHETKCTQKHTSL